MRKPCLIRGCPAFTTQTRCAMHERARDAARGSRQDRGYDRDHDRARGELKRTLPAPCGYCRVEVYPNQRWVAAHLVDGRPEYGWMIAHPACNERAKVRHRGDGGVARMSGSPSGPAPSVPITHSPVPMVDL